MPHKKEPRNLSVDEYFLRKYRDMPRADSFEASSKEKLEEWKKRFIPKLRECLGPFPKPCAPDPELIEIIDEGPYWREKIVFNSETDIATVAYVLVPKNIAAGERRPAILACHGHGNGKDDVCDIDHGESHRRESIANLNYTYAKQFALEGYVVIAPDWRGFGERSMGGETHKRDSCNVLFIKGMLLGMNMLTLNIWDAMCAITYLESRSDVDSKRIGCAGLSYGGTITLFTTALDERIQCAVVSGYLNTFGDFAISRAGFCGNQTPTGLLAHGEMWDVGCLITPRPLLIESGIQDTGFPIESSRKAADVIRKCYEVAMASEHFAVDEFHGGHRWNGAKAYDWMAKWLNHSVRNIT